MNLHDWEELESGPTLSSVRICGADLKKGDRVRLQPQKGGDVLDMALAGRVAVIDSIEQDYDGKVHLGVVLEDDPGRDLGWLRQPGHRFFFSIEEVKALETDDGR